MQRINEFIFFVVIKNQAKRTRHGHFVPSSQGDGFIILLMTPYTHTYKWQQQQQQQNIILWQTK